MKLSYKRPILYPKQEKAIFAPERYALIEASTKSGKTHGCIAWLLEKALFGEEGGAYWWIAPVYSQARIAFERMKKAIRPYLKYKGLFKIKEDDMSIAIKGKGTLTFKSGEKPDNLYGEDVWAAVIDEASRLKEASWFAVRSTLTATEADVRIIGNVRGKSNWFWHLCRLAEDGREGWAFFRLNAYDAVNAGVLSAAEIQDAKDTLPEDIFNELYLAIASDDKSNPFGEVHIYACRISDTVNGQVIYKGLSTKEPVCFGVDLGRKRDYTVIIGLDEDQNVCRFVRFKKKDNLEVGWEQIIERIWIVVQDKPCLVDSTGIGDVVFEYLVKGTKEPLPNYEGYNMGSLQTKQKLMEGLALDIQRHRVGIPKDSLIESELLDFEYTLVERGISYSAPAGMYDDCVVSLALACRKFNQLYVLDVEEDLFITAEPQTNMERHIDEVLNMMNVRPLHEIVEIIFVGGNPEDEYLY